MRVVEIHENFRAVELRVFGGCFAIMCSDVRREAVHATQAMLAQGLGSDIGFAFCIHLLTRHTNTQQSPTYLLHSN